MDIKAKIIVNMALVLLCSEASYAAESGKSSYPPGGSMFFIGEYPPYPGNYLQSLTYYGTSNRVNDHNGDKIKNLDFDLKVASESLRFVTAWNAHILKADYVASEMIITYASVRNSLNIPNGRVKNKADGIGDIILAPLALQWNLGAKKKLQTAATIYYVIPAGSYSNFDSLNISNNHYSIQPTLGFKYKAENGIEVGISPRISFNWKNEDTKYKNGTEFFADYILGYKMGNWEPGITGYYSTQFENDEVNGKEIKNSKTEGFSVGPALYYNLDNKVFISGSYQRDLMAKNKSENNSFFLSVAFPY